MKLLFICLSALKFDVETPTREPLGGTESAVCYLAPELAKLGHQVALMCNTERKTLRGVDHLPISKDLHGLDPDVVILVSAPQVAPSIRKTAPRAKLILWNHMRPDQPVMQLLFEPARAKMLDHIVYVSESQRQAFAREKKGLPVPLDGPHTQVINNAVAPCFENMFDSAAELEAVKQCKGAYTSAPYRGLALLAEIKELPIEVYSSMAVYQGDDQAFAALYASLKKNECLGLRGSLPQQQLMKALREVAFLVYPSTFVECHSIAIIEAMAAGLKIITTEVASPPTEYIDSMSRGSLDDYRQMLRKNIQAFRSQPEAWADKMWQQVQYVNAELTWRKKAGEWDQYLRSLAAGLKPTQQA